MSAFYNEKHQKASSCVPEAQLFKGYYVYTKKLHLHTTVYVCGIDHIY